jgi:catechol 2,3-dioxygenase-like lactoylglutathione lyase family enzyme
MTQRVHISVPASNLEASVGFYRSLFGVEPSKLRGDYANFRLDAPPIHLAVVGSAAATQPGADRHHFGIEVPTRDELESWLARLDDLGRPMRRELDQACCYARADKAWLTDPDGHAWELWVRTGEADRLEPESQACCG